MSHFDEIAEKYQKQIPEHIRLHYLGKKIKPILSFLGSLGKRKHELVGLDLGCGLGWHTQECFLQGYSNIVGLDSSKNEIKIARVTNPALNLVIGTAETLPFKGEIFDFVYSINMFHHLSKDSQISVFREVERILGTEGYFFLHEINLLNPLFGLYMRYIFPRRKEYDTGEEEWVPTNKLRDFTRLELVKVEYFTFVPDFTPKCVFPMLRNIESALENTPLRKYGIHYLATFRKARSIHE